jgi:hypothetical protein
MDEYTKKRQRVLKRAVMLCGIGFEGDFVLRNLWISFILGKVEVRLWAEG